MRTTSRSDPGAAPGSLPGARPAPAMAAEGAVMHESGSSVLDAFDLGMVVTVHAFQHWMHKLVRDAGFPHLTVIDSVLLDQLGQRANHKRLADICFILNTEDSHVIGYSLRKLAGLGIVDMARHGKEVRYSISPDHEARLAHLRQMQQHQLLETLSAMQVDEAGLAALGRKLRQMSRLYDQAARAAASLY